MSQTGQISPSARPAFGGTCSGFRPTDATEKATGMSMGLHVRESPPTPDRSTLCVAVLGTGSIGMRHLTTLQRMVGVRPLAVPRRSERLHELTQAGFSTAKGLDDAVQQGARLCVIATETGQHLADGLAAIDRGLDVLVEKPMATNAREAVQLNRRAQEAGRTLVVGCVLRFSESLNACRELLPKVGRLHTVQIACQSYLPEWRPARPYRESYSARADQGGVLRDLIHELDYAGWLFGWPKALQAHVRNLGRLGIEADEAADLLWQTPEGAAVSVNLDYLTRPPRRIVRALGEFGTLEWDGIAGTVTLALAGAPVHMTKCAQSRDGMYAAQAQAVVHTVLGRRDPRTATAEDGVRALAVCDAARLASERRHEMKVEYPS